MTDNCEVPDEVLQYMHENPVYNIEQEKRYEDTNQILQGMKIFFSHFQNYVTLGEKICEELNEINNSLADIDTVTQDEIYSQITRFFVFYRNNLQKHFSNCQRRNYSKS